MQVDAFSGKTATAAKQDIYAKSMMMALCAALVFPIEEHVINQYEGGQKLGSVEHLRKTNLTFAYCTFKGILIGTHIKRMIRSALTIFDKQVEANTEVAVRTLVSSKKKAAPPVPNELQKSLTLRLIINRH